MAIGLGVSVAATAKATYNTKDGTSSFKPGAELYTGSYDGTTPMWSKLSVGAGYPYADAKFKIGGEVPFAQIYNYTAFGMLIYGEVQGEANLKKTQDTNTAKDGHHEFSIDGGGGVELTYRTPYFDSAIGVKGGYKHNSIFSEDTDLRKECRSGHPYVAPTLRIKGFIPGTQIKADYLAGLGIGAEVQYDVLNHNLEGAVTLSYTF